MSFGELAIFSVTEVNALVREIVEENFDAVSVTGEVSNFKRHSSGHLYFTLKDETAQLRTACFRSSARGVKFDIQDGSQVVAHGRLTLYEPYGQYQLVAEQIEEAGQGELERRFRLLLARLSEEGLFDDDHKLPLPRFPLTIGVITSPTGAAVRDVISTLQRRWPCSTVLLAPVRVQGEMAAGEIVGALDSMSRARDVDVVILTRGGGSIEDLWAFNEEAVARAIYGCRVPVISAVGHETDVTIADHVADFRAATPTAAAELAAPVLDDVMASVQLSSERLERHITMQVRLQHHRLGELIGSYALGKVRGRIEQTMQSVDYAMERMNVHLEKHLSARRARVDKSMASLGALDPRSILSRGYAICAESATGTIVRDAEAAMRAQMMHISFHDGGVNAEVKERIE